MVVVAVAVVAALVVWFAAARKTPQNSPGKSVVVDRPAGPGAESQRADERGTLESGPPRPDDRRPRD